MNIRYLRYIILLLALCLLPQFGSAQSNKDFQKLTERAMALTESSAQDEINMFWLFLGENSRVSQPVVLTEKARKRRAKVDPVGLLIDEKDFPISDDILERIKSTGAEIRRVSRWLNAVSVNATNSQLMPLASLSEVKRIDLVEILKASSPDVTVEKKHDKVLPYGADDFEYGYSLFQHEFINAIKLHQIGYTGWGILMALFDSGFDFYHHAFDSASILTTWDFINDDASVDEPGCPDDATSLYQNNHGTSVMGVIGGNIPDTLIGIAPHVDFILAKTEITCGELEIKIEEDNWVAAAQWADSIGADGGRSMG